MGVAQKVVVVKPRSWVESTEGTTDLLNAVLGLNIATFIVATLIFVVDIVLIEMNSLVVKIVVFSVSIYNVIW